MKQRRTSSSDELNNYLRLFAERSLSELKISIEASLDQRNTTLESLKDENEGLKSELTRLKSSLESVGAEHEEYKSSMVDKIEHFKQIYDEKFQWLQNDRETLIQKLRNKVSQQIDEVVLLDTPQSKSQETRSIKRLKDKLSKRKDKLNMTLKRTRELSDLNAEKDKIIQVKSQNIEDLVLINKRSEQKIEELLRKIDELQSNSAKVEMLEAKVSDQMVSLQNMSEQKTAITAENEALSARLSYIESEQETISQTQEKMIEDANLEINNLKSIENSLKEKLETKSDEVVDVTGELQRIKDDLETKLSDIDSFKDKIFEIEAKNTELTEQLAEVQSRNQYITRENEDLRSDLRKQVEQNISTQSLVVKLKESLKRRETGIQHYKRSTSNKISTKNKGMEITLIDEGETNSPLAKLPVSCKVKPVNIPNGIALETIID